MSFANEFSSIEPLSAREREILAILMHGVRNRQIAAKLHISIYTVQRHLVAIYAKLGAKNRTQAVLIAQRLQIIE